MRPTDVDYDGAISASYEQGRGLSADAVATWRRAVEIHVPDQGAIVDVGAGTGRFARALDTVAPRRVVAVEPSAGMRAAATRPIASQVSWLAGSAEALPLSDASAGLVWSAFTTHYFDLDAAAAEFAVCPAPGRQGTDLACVPRRVRRPRMVPVVPFCTSARREANAVRSVSPARFRIRRFRIPWSNCPPDAHRGTTWPRSPTVSLTDRSRR